MGARRCCCFCRRPARPPPHPGSGNRALPAAAARRVRGGSHRRAGGRVGKFAGRRPVRVSAPRSPGPTRRKAANAGTFASCSSAETFLKSHSVPGRRLLGFGRVLCALSAFGFCHSLGFVPFLISANLFIFLPMLFLLPLEVSSGSWGSVEFLFVFPRPPGKEFGTFQSERGRGTLRWKISSWESGEGFFHIFTLFNCLS